MTDKHSYSFVSIEPIHGRVLFGGRNLTMQLNSHNTKFLADSANRLIIFLEDRPHDDF